jgi:hypothetical protein
MVTALRMTARMQLTVVHNKIPNDSLTVVATVVDEPHAGFARARPISPR